MDCGFPSQLNLKQAVTLLTPPERGKGHWVGAPSAHNHQGETYLAVRFRNPVDRGYVIRIYEKIDEEELTERAEIKSEELNVESIERPALITNPESGEQELYIPVDHANNDWTIQKLDGVSEPEQFDPSTARPVFSSDSYPDGLTAIKDPYIFIAEGRYYMYYAGYDGYSEQAYLATSLDGEQWKHSYNNPVMEREHWHDYHTRISSIVPVPNQPAWLVFYGGSNKADYENNLNLRTGFGYAEDLHEIVDKTKDAPCLTAPITKKAVGIDQFATCRYLDILQKKEGHEIFMEMACEDGSFELSYIQSN